MHQRGCGEGQQLQLTTSSIASLDLSFTIYSYQVDKDEWEEHAESTYQDTALTIINGHLTTIGGEDRGGQVTNKVLILKGGRWEEEVPPLRRARWDHALVSDGHTVVVAGGYGGGEEEGEHS